MSILNLCEETKVRIKGPTEDIIESLGETVKNKICFWHVMILLFIFYFFGSLHVILRLFGL